MGLPNEESKKLVELSLGEITKLVDDQNKFVQYSALKSLSYICADAGQAILAGQHFIQFLNIVFSRGLTQ